MEKGPEAFRTISEVADEIDVPQHVLRFWESRFAQIRPLKRGGGRRFYRPEDVDLLRGIRHLLYGEGYTIRGVQRILREHGSGFVQNVWRSGAEQPSPPPEDERDEADRDAAGAGRAGPDLSAFSLPGLAPAKAAAPAAERREPMLAGPDSAPATSGGLSAEDRRRLQSAVDELLHCRRLIETAMAEGDAGEAARSESRA